jgi:hypothetical protein
MDDNQRMTLYTLARLEDMRNQSENAKIINQLQRSATRWVAFSIVVVLGLVIWLVA